MRSPAPAMRAGSRRSETDMNNTLTVEPNSDTLGGSGIPRMALTAAFVFLGLVLLYLANRHVRRSHKTKHRRRY
jgi:hypothetical protein